MGPTLRIVGEAAEANYREKGREVDTQMADRCDPLFDKFAIQFEEVEKQVGLDVIDNKRKNTN